MLAVGRTLSLVAGAVTTLAVALSAQTMSFEEYDPPSSLVVPEHRVTRAKYPFIDVHSHQSLSANYQRLTREMDAMNMRAMVNLSGRTGDALATAVRNAQGAAPGRFAFFANLQFSGIDDPQWGVNAAAQLERDPSIAHRLYALAGPSESDIFVVASNSGVNGSIEGIGAPSRWGPALRQRPADIDVLAEYFRERGDVSRANAGVAGKRRRQLHDRAGVVGVMIVSGEQRHARRAAQGSGVETRVLQARCSQPLRRRHVYRPSER